MAVNFTAFELAAYV